MSDANKTREERLRNLFETMGEGVLLVAPDGRILQTNPAARQILRSSLSEIDGDRAFASGIEFIQLDGTPVPEEMTATAVVLREKRPVKNLVLGVRRRRLISVTPGIAGHLLRRSVSSVLVVPGGR